MCSTALVVLTVTSGTVAAKRYRGRRIDLSFKQAELTNIFRMLSEVGRRQIAVSHGVKARVDIQLKNTPWDKVLDDLIRDNRLQKVKIGSVLYICPEAEAKKKLRFKPPWPRNHRGDLRIRGIRVADAIRLIVGEKRSVLVDPSISGRTELALMNTRRNDMLAVLLRKEGLDLTTRGTTIRVAPPGSKSRLRPLEKTLGNTTAPKTLGTRTLQLRGVLNLRPPNSWAMVENRRGEVGLIRRGDRVGDRTVHRILRHIVILRHATEEDMALRIPDAYSISPVP